MELFITKFLVWAKVIVARYYIFSFRDSRFVHTTYLFVFTYFIFIYAVVLDNSLMMTESVEIEKRYVKKKTAPYRD